MSGSGAEHVSPMLDENLRDCYQIILLPYTPSLAAS